MQILIFGTDIDLSGVDELDRDIHIDVVGPGPSPVPPFFTQERKGEKIEAFDEDRLKEHLADLDPELPIVVRIEGTSTVHVPDFEALIDQARNEGRDLAIEVFA